MSALEFLIDMHDRMHHVPQRAGPQANAAVIAAIHGRLHRGLTHRRLRCGRGRRRRFGVRAARHSGERHCRETDSHRLFLGLGPSEDRDDLALLARHLEELPAALAPVGPPADELFPLPGARAENAQVGDVLPVGRIRRAGTGRRLGGHRRGSGETISRVLFTRWYEQMVISLGWLLPATSCGLPAARTTRAGSRCLFVLAPTGGCRAAPVARRAVGSYPTVSPLPFGYKGGLFSVALFRRLTAPRRYLAVCPVELGLSSNGPCCRPSATIGPTTSREEITGPRC